MLKPGGLMFVATLNRTLKSFGLAIIGAEYVLGWLPKGTHQWEKFITPVELKGWLGDNGLSVKDETGRHLQPAVTAMAGEPRHGCELHAGGDEGIANSIWAISQCG